MSADYPSSSDLYATVDLSKKKRRNAATRLTSNEEAEIDTATYAVVDEMRNTRSSDNYSYSHNDPQLDTPNTASRSSNLCSGFICAKFRDKVVNSKCKINTAFFLSLVGCIALGIIIMLLIVIFVKLDNLERLNVNTSRITEDRLKILEKDIQTINQTTLKLSENISQFLHVLSDISLPDTLSDIMNLNFTSCAALKRMPSGYYSLPSSTGEQTRLYCDMDLTCGNITGGWMRVADLDLYNCPPGLRSQIFQGNIACIRTEFRGGCTPVLYNTYGIPYSKVCGTITGYGVNTPDGFRSSFLTNYNVNDNYVDGIVMQSGANHIWTYVAGQCTRCNAQKHHFIVDDWICDGRDCSLDTYCDGPLWDAPICGSSNPFFKNMSSFSTADIGLRVCRDENRNNEDIAITDVKIYVQ